MTYMCREAASDDFDSVVRLYRQLDPHDSTPEQGAGRRVFDRICAAEHLHILVLDADSEPVATAYLNVIPNVTRAARPYAVLENVVVDERFRSRGLGKRIMAYALQRAWGAGCYKVMLMTGSRREATHAFYRSCGFSGSDKVAFVARPSK